MSASTASFPAGAGAQVEVKVIKAEPSNKDDIKSKYANDVNPNILLRRAAQIGDCDKIRDAVAMGADLNDHDKGKNEKELEAEDDKSDGKKESKDGADEKKDDSKDGEDKKESADDKDKEKDGKKGDDSDDEELSAEEKQLRLLEKKKQALKEQRFITLDTALHIAARAGHAEATDLLIRLGATVDSRDRLECTPLHTAVSHDRNEVVEHLIKMQADLDARNKVGNTALHIACYMHHGTMIRLLLNAHADRRQAIAVKNRAGMTPIDYMHPKIKKIIAGEYPDLNIQLEAECLVDFVDDAKSDTSSSSAASAASSASKASSSGGGMKSSSSGMLPAAHPNKPSKS